MTAAQCHNNAADNLHNLGSCMLGNQQLRQSIVCLEI